MSVTHGMNLAEVRSLGEVVKSKGDRLVAIVGEIDTLVHGVTWEGPDAQTFKHEWWPAHKHVLLGAGAQIAGLGQSALNNAGEQDTTSAAWGGGPSSAGSPNGAAMIGGIPATAALGAAGAALGNLNDARSKEEIRDAYDRWATGRFAAGGESNYQCTGWANFRWAELGGPVVNGNGGAMAVNAGGSVDTVPRVGAMLSYGPGTDADPGHVMIVEEVRASADGRLTVRVSEMNVGDQNWRVGTYDEYRDTKEYTQASDGRFYDYRRRPMTVANLPGT